MQSLNPWAPSSSSRVQCRRCSFARRSLQHRSRGRHRARTIAAALSKPGAQINFLDLRGTLFDIDGTLGTTDPLHFRVYRETLIEAGYNGGQPITEAFFLEHISGRHNPEIAAELFPNRSPQWRDEWIEYREGRFRQLAMRELQPVQGLRRFTSWVQSRGLRRAAVTNAPRANAEAMVSGLGLNNFFETLVIGDECLRGKPYPDPYMQGLVRIGLRHVPHKVLALEDSPAGVRAAVAAKLPAVGLATSRPKESLIEAGAVIAVTDYEELMALIETQEQTQAEAQAAAES